MMIDCYCETSTFILTAILLSINYFRDVFKCLESNSH